MLSVTFLYPSLNRRRMRMGEESTLHKWDVVRTLTLSALCVEVVL